MKKQKMFVRILVLFLAFLMLLSVLLPVLMASASTASEKVQELEEQLKEIDRELDSIEDQTKKTQQAKAYADTQIAIVKEQISLLNESIEQQKVALDLKQQELDKKVIQINTEYDLLDSRIAAMYMTSSDGVLSSVLGATSFAELMTAADSMQRITVADTELLEKLSDEKAVIIEEQQIIDADLQTMQSDMELLEAKNAELAAYLQVQNNALSDLEAQKLATEEERQLKYEEYQEAVRVMNEEFKQNGGQMGDEFVSGAFIRPVPGYNYISSRFGWRTLFGKPDYHTGIDITGSNIYGAQIVAAADGVVTVARYGTTGYGIRVYIDHGGGYITRYGHCSALLVTEGQYVVQGQPIALVGSTGMSTGPHLHFEIRQNGVAIDPAPYLGY